MGISWKPVWKYRAGSIHSPSLNVKATRKMLSGLQHADIVSKSFSMRRLLITKDKINNNGETWKGPWKQSDRSSHCQEWSQSLRGLLIPCTEVTSVIWLPEVHYLDPIMRNHDKPNQRDIVQKSLSSSVMAITKAKPKSQVLFESEKPTRRDKEM
jgi:hypothetical protein